ncbi:hypothetical protein TRFO_17299 [Tritrichomonas foetus]|uniref:Uncharacterized protein n=1 Tax=Tritrichomonas foetus TaxID=1144522 RepID=A0A1J4KNE1_9EUKA|nr:hypothetical protein TRFO_17299 [Tritrichomonas foetus]|eukprot:OHT12755.1 hypothetical protein TRFO_17299 [Tritrichomonas foetus]
MTILNVQQFEMDKKEKKKLDLNVMRMLQENGIFNRLNSGLIADIAELVSQSEFDSMKPYREIRTDIDHQLTAEIVFEYLKRNNMTETIRCIAAETNNNLVAKPLSGNIANELKIEDKTDILHKVINNYTQDSDNIQMSFHENLISGIEGRLANLPESSPSKHGHSSSRHRKHKHESSSRKDDSD